MKRLLLTVLATPCALLSLPAMAQVEVRIWTLLSGGDGARMRSLVEQFNASQSGVRVVSTTLRHHFPCPGPSITYQAPLPDAAVSTT